MVRAVAWMGGLRFIVTHTASASAPSRVGSARAGAGAAAVPPPRDAVARPLASPALLAPSPEHALIQQLIESGALGE